jgi:hypothetical protein
VETEQCSAEKKRSGERKVTLDGDGIGKGLDRIENGIYPPMRR